MRWSFALLLASLSSCALVSGVGDLRVSDDVLPAGDGGPGSGNDGGVVGDGATGPDGAVTLPDGAVVKGGRLTGIITNPAGTRPGYGAAVYIPSGLITPFPAGVACDTCANLFSGLPAVASTVSGPDGSFVLDGVPPDAPFRLVIQVGRFRRQVTVPAIAASGSAVLAPALAHLPATQLGGVSGNAGEGDLPKIALVTGLSDQVECSLKKLGIALTEFTSPTGGGRVHFYNFAMVNGYTGGAGAYTGAGVPFPGAGDADALVDTRATLDTYNAVVLGCTGSTAAPTAPQQANVLGWTGSGGRLIATHIAAPDFIQNQPAPTSAVAAFTLGADSIDRGPPALPAKVDTSFVQGAAMASWLTSAGSMDPAGVLTLPQWRHDVASVGPGATRWLSGDSSMPPLSRQPPGGPLVSAFSFDAPVGAPAAMQCGRVAVPEMHVDTLVAHNAWPSECDAALAISPEDLAFEFLLLRALACLAPLTAPPTGP